MKIKPFKALVYNSHSEDGGYRIVEVVHVRMTPRGGYRASAYEMLCSDNAARSSVVPDNKANRDAWHRADAIQKQIDRLENKKRKVRAKITTIDAYQVSRLSTTIHRGE